MIYNVNIEYVTVEFCNRLKNTVTGIKRSRIVECTIRYKMLF